MDTKEKILSCAEELFYARGYDGTGVQEIAQKAGITKPTLYYYFGSKRGLLDTLLKTKYEKLREAVQGASSAEKGEGGPFPGEKIREKLHRTARLYYSYFHRERRFYLLLISLSLSAPESEGHRAVQPYTDDLYESAVELFRSSSEELGNMNGREEQFALSYIGIINQYLMRCTGQNMRRDDEIRRLDSLVDQYMYGIFS